VKFDVGAFFFNFSGISNVVKNPGKRIAAEKVKFYGSSIFPVDKNWRMWNI
jgi:hypothetical protein